MHDAPRDEDIVEVGRADRGGRESGRRLLRQRFPVPDGWRSSPGWRPSRGGQVLAAAALVVGLAAGYAAGVHQPRGVMAAPEPTTSMASASPASLAPPAPAPVTTFLFVGSAALAQGNGACSAQSGRNLALGVQVDNQSTVPLTLKSVKAVLPLGGLTPVSWYWAPCGALPQTLAGQADNILQPGETTWLTMMFNVKAGVGCPGPLPVQFTIGYLAAGRSATASLPGFPDLSQVPYTGCPALPGDVGVVLRQGQVMTPATRPALVAVPVAAPRGEPQYPPVERRP